MLCIIFVIIKYTDCVGLTELTLQFSATDVAIGNLILKSLDTLQ